MSSNYIAINAVALRLEAYATSGLPVTYKILSGTDKINITQNGDYYYVNPVALGFATLVAYQSGSADFAPALPVSKIVRVIGLPEDLSVEASLLTLPQDLNFCQVEVLEPPVPVIAELDSVPLEPTKVKISDDTPSSPIFVTTKTIPNNLSSVVAYDYNARPAGYPNNNPIVFEVKILTAPTEPQQINVYPIASPSVNYVLNLSQKVDKQYISDSAIVDTKGFSATELWDESNTNINIVTVRVNYLQTAQDNHGLQYNPLWRFSSRPSLQRTAFYYEDINNAEYNGKYQQEYSGNTVYDIRWREVGSTNPKYLHFVSVKMHTYIVHTNYLSSADGLISGTNVFTQLEDKLYTSGHIGNSDFQNWLYTNVYENYAPEAIHKLDNGMAIGGYVFSYDSNPVKALNINSLIPYADDKTAFDIQYPSVQDKEILTKQYIAEKAERSLNKYYEKTAGDILGAYNKWDIELNKNNWSPNMPVPFEEVYVNSSSNFGVNPYAIIGEGISLYTSSAQSFAEQPINVTIQEL